MQTKAVVEDFYEKLFAGDSDGLIALFAEDAVWNIPGNESVASWLGKRVGKASVSDFLKLHKIYIEPRSFEIDQFLIDGDRAVVTGDITAYMRQSDRLFESPFVASITVRNNQIVSYSFLGDSWKLVQTLDVSDRYTDIVKQYFVAVDNRDAEGIVALFADDAEIFFSQSGEVKGVDGLRSINAEFMKVLANLVHDIDGFKYTVSGNRVVVEGRESGALKNGATFADNRFCSVFEIEDNRIVRMYVYTDPSFLSMTDQYVDIVKQYFVAVDNGDGQGMENLFAHNVDIFYTHSGKVSGIEGLRSVGTGFMEVLASLKHHIDEFKYTVSGNRVVAEGSFSGTLKNGSSFANHPTCSVFEIEDNRIVRMYVYTDPSFLNITN